MDRKLDQYAKHLIKKKIIASDMLVGGGIPVDNDINKLYSKRK